MIQFFSKMINNKKGFTLIELIVVIAILGILAMVAVPRLGGFQESAREKSDNATMTTIRNAVLVGLANEDIKVGSTGGTITITTGTAATFEQTNITFKANDNITAVMTRLVGTDLKAQVTGKTGYVVTIKTDGDVEVKYK